MTISRLRTGAVLVACAALLTACAPGSDPGTAPTSTASAIETEIVGAWGTDAAGQPFLEFTAEGDVTGTDGCNGIVSTYAVVDDTVEIAPHASTLKACQGVDDWLRSVSVVQVSGDTLIVLDSSGTKLGELARG